MRRRTLRAATASAVIGLLAAFLGAGCGKEEPPPAPVVKKPVSREAAKAAEAAAGVPAEAQKAAPLPLYDPAGKRDPFVPFLRGQALAPRGPIESLPPLERYDLGELHFVGVLWGAKGYRALVEDAEGKGYTVAVGSRLGRNGGIVTRITDGEIAVRESFTDFSGAKIERESTLKLHPAGGKR